MNNAALVLGSGGITGTAWELGVLSGLAAAGLDLTGAATLVGTSAGSVTGAQLVSGLPIEALYERQLQPPVGESLARMNRRARLTVIYGVLRHRRDPEAFSRWLGAQSLHLAARRQVPSVEQRLATIGSRLPSAEWGERDLRIVAVDARSGVARVFTRDDGVPLAEAVAASCAVLGVYPPIPIGGRTYIDGGYRSGSNVDIARGREPIVVLAPKPIDAGPMRGPQQQLDALGVRGVMIAPDAPDAAALAAIGESPLDPAARRPAAEGGRVQAARVAEQIRAVWR
jgi:NTE family protein